MDKNPNSNVSDETAVFEQQEKNIHFGNYIITDELGSGAMGKVYKAYHCQLKRVVALKIPTNANKKDLERFMREAETMAQLKHPNIINIHEVGNYNNQPYLTMDYIDGEDLEKFCKKKSMSFKKIASLMTDICEAIDYAHKRGIIHRDLKPANIMMSKEKPIVMDFGLAKKSNDQNKISQTGMILGTIKYMSPEQAEAKNRYVSERSDVYSLGVILYELLTGKVPFSKGNSFLLLHDIVMTPPIAPREIKAKIPKDLENICLKALQKKPSHRYQSAKDFANDLSNYSKGIDVLAKSSKAYKSVLRNNKKLLIRTGLFVLFLLLSVMLSHYKTKSQKYIKILKKQQRNNNEFLMLAKKNFNFNESCSFYEFLQEYRNNNNNGNQNQIKDFLNTLRKKIETQGIQKAEKALKKGQDKWEDKYLFKAMRYLSKIIKISPKNAKAFSLLSQSIFEIDKHEEIDLDGTLSHLEWPKNKMINVLKKAITLNNDNKWAKFTYGLYLAKFTKQSKKGFVIMDNVTIKNEEKNNAWMYYYLAGAYEYKKKNTLALKYYKKAIVIDQNIWIYYDCAHMAIKMDDSEGKKYCLEIDNRIEIKNENEDENKNPLSNHETKNFYAFFTRYLLQKNKFSEAIIYYKKVIKLFPKVVNFHYEIAICYIKSKDEKNAKYHFQQCINIINDSDYEKIQILEKAKNFLKK